VCKTIHDVNGNHSAREWEYSIRWIELTRLVAGHPVVVPARYDDVRGLERFLESHPSCRAGLLVYAGSEIVRLGEKIVAVPWTAIAR
jgi:hypothetical protein